MRSLALVAIVAGALGVSTYARAASSERAAAIFRQGQEAFAHKSYAAAAAAFEQAAQLAPHPSAWLDAAEAWELDGALARAAEDCDRALAMPEVSEGHRHDAEVRLARLAPKIATLDVRTARAQLVRVDGAGELRAPGKHRIAPGHHVIVVLDLAGAPARTLGVDAPAGETTAVDLEPPVSNEAPPARSLATGPPSPAPASVDARRGPPVASWVGFGVAAVAAGMGVVTGAMTLSARSDFTNAPTVEARERFYRDRSITNVAWGIAGVAAGTGLVLWVAAPREGAPRGVAIVVRDAGVFLAHETRF